MLAPKRSYPYSQLASLFNHTRDLDKLKGLAQRLDKAELDLADAKRETLEYYAGKENEKRQADLKKALEHVAQLFDFPGWQDLPAVRLGRVFAVDASSYFARPGPRVIDGTELLAHLIHPELFSWKGAQNAFQRIVPLH